ncbi:MAG: phosphoglycerate dehydrogenase [Candidatus Omnitrophica bacterium]|nr:phosphoglycerate dehydrogenase [Candidatus Omnitrophota bacterium]MCF7877041.1 phosphoglycerate dehydrogenase [Candidatus Omnitrophota bacterium]MCF7891390.1 phosphoglycerate dehydrogenase [Candidatus Omnitrophota bacterium]MCF7896129.1 phosphoglycerate dehydrogenase [Candidatus Omnitrophota bacterium]MCF7897914.1 phosphoglycerate dehydrogenase [Candidatus Omnitrophota bacterium]
MVDKILISDKLNKEGVQILKDSGFRVDCKYGLSPEELKKEITAYQAIVIRSGTKLSADILNAAKNLKFIARAGVGVDNIDIKAATNRGIIVMNAPGGNTISTCEQTFALLLSAARNIPFAHNSLKNKKWERSKFKGTELYLKKLGIVGLGRIGKEVAKRALSFGMKVLVYDPFLQKEIAERLGIESVDLDDLIKNSDFITVHTPLTDATKDLISSKEFEQMKPSAFIINCARGGIINEDALAKALADKKIAGAAVDVYSKEPPLELKFIESQSLITTPHLGASTKEAQLNVAIEAANSIKDALLGKSINNAINYAQLEPEAYQIIQPYFNLADKMGSFISQLAEGAIKTVKISYRGKISTQKVDIIGGMFLKGLLARQVEKDINQMNAIDIAKQRGIKIKQIKEPEEEEYINSLRLTITTDKEEKSLEGTLFANSNPRFISLDNVYFEVSPSQHMLVINNKDMPGVIGFLGTTLGKNGVNIAGMSLGRHAPKGTALTILNIDNAAKEDVVKKIKANPSIISAKAIKL